jgi:DNA-binding transcriptional MerR regulator
MTTGLLQRPSYSYQARPKAGQKQRVGSGDWEGLANRQQKKLVRTYDKWAAKIKKVIKRMNARGASTAEITAYLDGQMPDLEAALLEATNQGIIKAARVSAGKRADNPAIQAIVKRQIRENTDLVKSNLVPNIHEKLILAAAGGAFITAANMNTAFNVPRAMPAQYAGGAYVAVFEVQKGLGKAREAERASEGLEPEVVRWVLDPRAEHCKTSPGYSGCPELAGEYPNGWNTLPTVPAGQVTCRGNCRCHLEVYRDGQWRRGVYDD